MSSPLSDRKRLSLKIEDCTFEPMRAEILRLPTDGQVVLQAESLVVSDWRGTTVSDDTMAELISRIDRLCPHLSNVSLAVRFGPLTGAAVGPILRRVACAQLEGRLPVQQLVSSFECDSARPCQLRELRLLAGPISAPDMTRLMAAFTAVTSLALWPLQLAPYRNPPMSCIDEPATLQALADAIERNTTLLHLDASGAEVSCAPLLKAVAINDTITSLVVALPPNDHASLLLAPRCTRLQSLNLANPRQNDSVWRLSPLIAEAHPCVISPARRNSWCIKVAEEVDLATVPVASNIAHLWQASYELTDMVAQLGTALQSLRIQQPVIDHDRGAREFAESFCFPATNFRLAQAMRGHLRKLSISGSQYWYLLRGMESWTVLVRPHLAEVALGLCAADLPTLVILSVFAQLNVPELLIRDFDFVMWNTVALVRTAYVKKNSN
jgi:hypothetical protein